MKITLKQLKDIIKETMERNNYKPNDLYWFSFPDTPEELSICR